ALSIEERSGHNAEVGRKAGSVESAEVLGGLPEGLLLLADMSENVRGRTPIRIHDRGFGGDRVPVLSFESQDMAGLEFNDLHERSGSGGEKVGGADCALKDVHGGAKTIFHSRSEDAGQLRDAHPLPGGF